MRNDFTSVIVERARYGRSRVVPKGADSFNRISEDEEDDAPTHQSMRAPWRHNRKERRDHLSPLRRYLRAQVGRPWNDVYSDICQVFISGAYGNRLREFVSWEVDVSVKEVDGELVNDRGYAVYADSLYVHPQTGVLTRSPSRTRRRWKNKPRFESVDLSSRQKLVKVDGLWFVVSLATIPGAEVTERPFDVVLKQSVFAEDLKYTWGNELYRTWGPGLYAAEKRQANSREISRHVKGADSEKMNKQNKQQCYRPQSR